MRTRTKAVLLVAVALVVALPIVAVAATDFDDVPTGHLFYDDITWLRDAGITLGCNPPSNTKFCPDDSVKRQQMAAFMRRFAKFLGAEDGVVSEADHAATANSATTAGDASKLGGLAAGEYLTNDRIVMTYGGVGFLPYLGGPSTMSRYISGMDISGDGAVVLPIPGPHAVGDTEYGLESVTLCYETSGAAQISTIYMYASSLTGSYVDAPQIYFDGSTRTGAACDVLTVNAAVDNAVGLYVFAGNGDSVRLEGVVTTWVDASLGTLTGTHAPAEGGINY